MNWETCNKEAHFKMSEKRILFHKKQRAGDSRFLRQVFDDLQKEVSFDLKKAQAWSSDYPH